MISSIFCNLLFLQYLIAQEYFDPLIFFGRPKYGTMYEVPDTTAGSDTEQETIMIGRFEQQLDHFSDNNATFGQYYYHRSMRNAELVFLVLGGNGELSSNWFLNKNSPYVKWADEHRAVIFGLEHRFYGHNLNTTGNIAIESLQYLTISQAIKDAENFITKQKQMSLQLRNHRWIIFGASYAGSIALWLRQKNPNLVHAVVASSSPIEAKLDAYEYNMIVETFFNDSCKEKIEHILGQITTHTFKEAGRESLDTDLGLKSKLKFTDNVTTGYTNMQFLFWTIQQPFQLLTQYYKSGNTFAGYGLTEMCNDLVEITNVNAGIASLYTAIQAMYKTYYDETIENLNNDYELAIETLKANYTNVSTYDAQHRVWLWQLCTELGYSFTTDYGISNMFGSTVSPSLFITFCKDVFDMNVDDILKGIANTNKVYGGIAGYTGTNVVITSGLYDPFSYFIKKHSTDKSVRILTVNDAGHASDAFASNNQNVLDVQRLISAEIRKFANAQTTPSPIAPTESPFNVEFRVKQKNVPKSYTIQENVTHVNSYGRSMLPAIPGDENPTPPKYELAQVFFGRPPTGFMPTPNWSNVADEKNFQFGYIFQPVNHSDDSTAYFHQSFCRNGAFEKDGGPVYLLIGGESAIDCNWIKDESSSIVQMAKDSGAIMYYLEHRFFGDSIVPGLNKLKYLTIDDAIEDIGSFITSTTADNPVEKTKSWIAFGSSYAGTVAIAARATYPDLIAGAVISSALINPQFSYTENAYKTSMILEAFDPKCAPAVKKVFHDLRTDLYDGKAPGALFPEFVDWTYDTTADQQYFFLTLYSAVQGALLFDKVDGLTDKMPQIADICKNIVSVEGLSNYFTATNTLFENGNVLNRVETIAKIRDTHDKGNKKEDIATANWIWISCSQFASFPTTDAGDSVFGSPTSVDFFIDFCKDTYGDLLESNYNSLMLENKIRVIDYFIGVIEESLGNTIITSGYNDPRFSLTIPEISLNSVSSSGATYTILNGTAHGTLFYPSSAGDSEDVVNMRKTITSTITSWKASPTPTSWPPFTSKTDAPPVTYPTFETSTRSAKAIGHYVISFILFMFIL